MKRILMMVLRNLFYVPSLVIQLFHHAGNIEKYTAEEHNKVLKHIVYRANCGGNVSIQAFGMENIPQNSGFMLFPNHQGMYDMLALVDACPFPLSVVAKKEVKNIPFLKQVFKIMGALFMDRADVRQSMKIIMEVSKEVAGGKNYTIFPEGTRSKNGNCVGEFKGGSFKAATKAKCPIVPVALIDSFQPFDTKSIKPVVVQVHFLKPFLYEEYKNMNTSEIAQEVRQRIVQTIEKYEKKVIDN